MASEDFNTIGCLMQAISMLFKLSALCHIAILFFGMTLLFIFIRDVLPIILRWRKPRKPIRLSNLSNNHDHLKFRHTSEESAEREITRIRRCGRDVDGSLVSYYNTELKAWFVGNSQY